MKKALLMTLACLALTFSAMAQDNVDILKTEYNQPGVAESFKVGSDWYPYPAYSDREAWDKLMTKDMKKAYIKKAKKYLGYKWQHIPASTYIALNTTGDKQAMRKIEGKNREAIIALMMGELAEGKGQFLMDIADGLWFYGTSYHWHHSNQTYGQLPRYEMEKVGLGSVRLGVTIPIVWHFFHEEMDKIDKRISTVVLEAIQRIIIDPAMQGYGTKKFKWMGPINNKRGNWNPWCNHGSLFAILLLEKDQEKLNAAVKASVENVDQYLATYSPDGACEEGVGYWGQSVGRLYEYLQLLYDASGGKFDVFKNKFVNSMAEYPSRAYGGTNKKGRYMKINFGDGNASGGGSAMMYYKVGTLFGHDELRDFALSTTGDVTKKTFIYPGIGGSGSEGYRVLENVRHYGNLCAEIDKLNQRIKDGTPITSILDELRGNIPHVTWYPAMQQAFLRTGDNWLLGAKAGHNGEPHGHNDVGSFILYINNIPFFVDPGVGTYVKDTFSKNRFKIWSMASPWHSCPAPNSVQQMNGKQYGASSSTFEKIKKEYVMTSEISGAYPKEAACKSYVRTFRLKDSNSKSSLVIEDNYELTERKASDDVHFITPGEVTLGAKGVLTIEKDGEVIKMTYPSTLIPEIERMDIEDSKLARHWDGVLFAIRFKSAPDAPLKGTYRFTVQMK